MTTERNPPSLLAHMTTDDLATMMLNLSKSDDRSDAEFLVQVRNEIKRRKPGYDPRAQPGITSVSVSPGSEWQKEAEENGRRSAAPAPRMCLIIDEAEEVDKTCDKALDDPLMGMDAQKWAKEFMRIWAGRWAEVDEALMISWFANAIMRGFDEGGRRQKETDREELDALRQAIGMLTTLHPTMVMDPPNPVGMALQVHAHVTQEIAALKAKDVAPGT